MAQQVLFYVFAFLSLVGALTVVFSRHPVRAVLSLVLTLVCGSVLWLLLEVEFLALMLIVVYVGAVMVLFLFVVMMIDVEVEAHQKTYVKYWPIGLLLGVIFFGVLGWGFSSGAFSVDHFPVPPSHSASYSNTKELGMLLFTQYLYPFELAGVLLLSGMIAAIALTFRGRKPGTKTQVIREQIRVKSADRLTMVELNFSARTITFPSNESKD
jgi:NADH-quinone oxidoreductase subunit J